MALIKCRECEKEYSNLAHACPNCGCPTSHNIVDTLQDGLSEETPNNEVSEVISQSISMEFDKSIDLGHDEDYPDNEKETVHKFVQYGVAPITLFGFDGRMTRREFLPIFITYMFCSGASYAYSGVIYSDIYDIVSKLVILISFLFMISIFTKRLHDVNHKGWFLLIAFIPIAGFYLLYLLLKAGDININEYGSPNPEKRYGKKSIVASSSIFIVIAILMLTIPLISLYTPDTFNRDIESYTFEDGTTYKGEWKGNLMHGKGTCTLSDGTVFTGTWVNNHMSGLGTMVTPNGERYEGMFNDDSFDGYGTYTIQNTTFEGMWTGGRLDGTAIITLANGDVYDGEVENGLMDGYGTFTSADGRVVSGRFSNGKYLGRENY